MESHDPLATAWGSGSPSAMLRSYAQTDFKPALEDLLTGAKKDFEAAKPD